MSGGEQQMLAIARVMMAGARLILMDEPTQGLAPALIRHIRDMIRELVRLDITVLLVEQNARVALQRVRPRLHHGKGRHRVRGTVGRASDQSCHP